MVRNNGRSSRWPMASTRSLVTTYATYGTLSLRIDYQPPSQKQKPVYKGGICLRLNICSHTALLLCGKYCRSLLPVIGKYCRYKRQNVRIYQGHRLAWKLLSIECHPTTPKGANDMKHIPSPLLFWVIIILMLFADTISNTLTSFILN